VVIDKTKIIGWWQALQWMYPNDNPPHGDFLWRYFGRDSFYYEENLANVGGGSSTGKWSWLGNDTVLLQLIAGYETGTFKLAIAQLSDTLRFKWYGVGIPGVQGNYKKLDSTEIISLPISTVAGNGSQSFTGDGGLASAATLNHPIAVSKDGYGNVYIADHLNHAVRKVNASDGKISTIAGIGNPGYTGDGGLATAAYLNNPSGIAIDAANNIYIVDQANHAVRKINASDGKINTIAGTILNAGFSGDGTTANAAKLNSPLDIALDASGNIYVMDAFNWRIRKVDATTGIISTVAGNGSAGNTGDGALAINASIRPGRIAVDGAGNIWITDNSQHTIRKITAATGIISTIAGKGNAGYNGEEVLATNAFLSGPIGVATDAGGNIYISEVGIPYGGGTVYKHTRVRKISSVDGKIKTVAGSGGSMMQNLSGYSGDGPHATAYLLYFPSGIYVDTNNNLYIADMWNNRVRMVNGQ
jgi:sugar lactone lactonase YvrE